MLQEAKTLIEKAWSDRRLLKNNDTIEAIRKIIGLLNNGDVRVAEPSCTGEWLVNEWIKKAVILYFPVQETQVYECGPFEYFDKIPLKKEINKTGARVVPNAVVRFGAYIDKDVVIMPSYTNIGAHVESGTLIDTFATVGSCAQIGKNVHLSYGAVIGGVLEPPQALPVIIEDGCFIGSKTVINEGIHVEKESIIAANTFISQSAKIIDVTGKEPVEVKEVIPSRSIVTNGTTVRHFPAGKYKVPCALIIGKRKKSDDLKSSLKAALNEFNLVV